jgi:phage RecT family recombinase
MPDNNLPATTTKRDLATLPFDQAFDAFTAELAVALPDHIPVERFKRVCLTAINSSTPQNDLAHADRKSLFQACVRCANDGLYPDGREAALVVFNTKIKDQRGQESYAKLVQYMPMIQGIRKRMRNTGEVLSATAEVVYEHDHFRRQLGEEPKIEHEPPPFGIDRGKLVGAYAIIKLKNGETLRDSMSVVDIERTRAQSRAPNSLMWTKFYDEGARKTVLRRCSKQAPTGSELDRLLARDEQLPQIERDTEQHPMPARPQLSDFGGDAGGWIDDEPPPAEPEVSEVSDPQEQQKFEIFTRDGEVLELALKPARTALEIMLAAARSLDQLDAITEDHKKTIEAIHAALPEDEALKYVEMIAEYRRQIEIQAQAEAEFMADVEAEAAPVADGPAPAPSSPTRGRPRRSRVPTTVVEDHAVADRPPANDYDATVVVDYQPGAGLQEWFGRARLRLREMQHNHAGPERYTAFRKANVVPLQGLQKTLSSWHRQLEDILAAGEKVARP